MNDDMKIVVKLTLDDDGYKVATVNAGRLMNELKRTFESTAVSVKRLENHSESLGRKFRDLVLTLGNLRFVAMDINDIFFRLPMSMLKTAGELEKMQQLMTGLSKETDKAKAQLEGIRDFKFVVGMAKTAPFDIKALSDSFVKMKTAGIDPANGSIQALIDSVARFGGSGESLKRASVAIQQMSGKGVISMEELRQQLGEAIPTAMKSMADGLEMTVAELSEKVSKGIVKAGPALEKMFLRMQIDNAGAAAEMMTTWVGMTARLKTEWDLTAQHIVNNGLGDAAKLVVSELTTGLQSEEFREFGKDFGQGLGEVTRDALALAKVLMSLREEISFGVKAWLAYKLVTSVIAPLGRAISTSMTSVQGSIRNTTQELINSGKAHTAISILSASHAKYEAQSRAQALSEKLATDQKELASVQARNAAILAQDRKLAAELAALRMAESKRNVNNIGDQQRILRDMDALSLKNSELLARQGELQRSIPQTTLALNSASAAAAAKARELGRLAQGAGAASVAATALAGATRAAGAAMNFLGGPIGVALTLISLLAGAWGHVTQKANEARAAQDRAASRTSVEGDPEKLKGFAEDAEEEVKRLAAMMKMQTKVLPDGTFRKKNKSDIEAEQAEYAAAVEKHKAALQAIENAKTTIQEEGAKKRASNLLMETQRAMGVQTDAARQEINLLRKKKDELEASAKTEKDRTSPEFKKAKAAIENEQAQILLRDYDARIAIVKKKSQELRDAAKALPSSDKAGIGEKTVAAQVFEAELDRLESERSGLAARASINPVEAIGGAGKKKPGSSTPEKDGLQELIDKLAIERVQLVAELKGFDDEVKPAADKAQAAYEKVMEMWRQGDLNVTKGGKLVRKPTESRAKVAAEEARAQELLKQDIKDKAKAVRDAESVRDYINGMLPSYQDALEQLMNPLGVSKMGAKERTVEKWIAENGDKIKSYASEQKTEVEAVIRDIRNMAQMEDTSKVFAEMARDTKQLNDGLVSDSRDAARARAEADNERHRSDVQNLIDLRFLSGATMGEIAQLQNQLALNMAARNATLAQNFKGPIEKMVEAWRDSSRNMEEASVGWANKTMDAFTELVTTGKADFKSLANSVIADIIRINMQKAVGNAVAGAASWVSKAFLFADGGIMSEMGSAPLKKYAAGGIANSPQVAIYGEGSMPEAYVPLPDGRTIPVTMTGVKDSGKKAGDQYVEININVQRDGKTTESVAGNGDQQQYRQLGERIKSVVREELTVQKRPGGILY